MTKISVDNPKRVCIVTVTIQFTHYMPRIPDYNKT